MKEVSVLEVGLKIGPKEGPSFFGLEQVKAALNSGARVLSIREGALITSKVGEDADNVEMAVTGFSLQVIMDVPKPPKGSGKPWWRLWR